MGSTIAFSAVSTTVVPGVSWAGKPELDPSGELFSPKSTMIRGGSAAARGVSPRQQNGQSEKVRIEPGLPVQTVYEARFITYLARFLLTFDPAAQAWWVEEGLSDSWEQSQTLPEDEVVQLRQSKFAEFAESLEIGLADYFVGPYGSYSSVGAAKAGLLAAVPATSSQPASRNQVTVLSSLWSKLIQGMTANGGSVDRKRKQRKEGGSLAKEGILNLYALLKARYTSVAAKRQLAILFSFISSPELQPTAEIRSLLGEADNATITRIDVRPATLGTLMPSEQRELDSRTSPDRGGGYSLYDTTAPQVTIDDPPALGDGYPEARAKVVMKPTGRILRITMLDGGAGYTSAPMVKVIKRGGVVREAQATAILDREGSVQEIVVLDPGYGYHGQSGLLQVRIDAPPRFIRKSKKLADIPAVGTKAGIRTAKAIAELEYQVVGIDIKRGGSGFDITEPPQVTVSPPEELPDWYVTPSTYLGINRVVQENDGPALIARVGEMRMGDGTIVSTSPQQGQSFASYGSIDDSLIERLEREPLELLPAASVRPRLVTNVNNVNQDRPMYVIDGLPLISYSTTSASKRFRAVDPIFGPIGSVPVTRGALQLSASEYSRLALSGALCTVIVRTLLNPLELIKTKSMLNNDVELMQFAREEMKRTKSVTTAPEPIIANAAQSSESPIAADDDGTSRQKIGTVDMMISLVKLRGFGALFQSADITFLASLVFGSFGFGATELFRRSFTLAFFSEGSSNSSDLESEFVLLAAAAVATIITSAAASPFEVLRVKSMGTVKPLVWTEVLRQYVMDNRARQKPNDSSSTTSSSSSKRASTVVEFSDTLHTVRFADLLPLWSGFAPTASRELPFAVTKFLAFDLIAKSIISFVNGQFLEEGALPVQVGVGTAGLAISAAAGALAGIAGALVSHPADLILTLTSASSSSTSNKSGQEMSGDEKSDGDEDDDWKDIIRDLLTREGGVANLFIGLPARATFFFLVIGLQFFLYDYVKNIFQVGSEDLSLVLDVFYAIRQGLVEASTATAT